MNIDSKKLTKYALLGLGGIVALWIVAYIAQALLFTGMGLSSSDSKGHSVGYAPSADMVYESEDISGAMFRQNSMPVPPPDEYTSDLESYETTDYRASARTREFDRACSLLSELKRDTQIHFKSLSTGDTSCHATFFVEENGVADVILKLEDVSGIKIDRDTSSVTRTKQNVASRIAILSEQLRIVESTLSQAEAQYTRLMALAESERDVESLTTIITTKLNTIDQMSNRRVSLASQIRSLTQEAADLEERTEHPRFTVSFTKAYALDPEVTSRKWERAFAEFRDTMTSVAIGFTVLFATVVLRGIQIIFYALVAVVIAKYLWQLARYIWRFKKPEPQESTSDHDHGM